MNVFLFSFFVLIIFLTTVIVYRFAEADDAAADDEGKKGLLNFSLVLIYVALLLVFIFFAVSALNR